MKHVHLPTYVLCPGCPPHGRAELYSSGLAHASHVFVQSNTRAPLSPRSLPWPQDGPNLLGGH